jgi:TonB family protein
VPGVTHKGSTNLEYFRVAPLPVPGVYFSGSMQAELLTPVVALALTATLFARSGQPLRVDGLVQERKLVFAPRPIYPKLAIQAHISGTVKLAVLIGEDGTAERIRLISGHPLLVKAAMDAVKQWEYEPTLLNGVPVKVITTVDVHFTLGPSTDPPDQPGRKQAVVHAAQARD